MTIKAAAWQKRAKPHSVDEAVYFYHLATTFRASIVESALHPCAHPRQGCTLLPPEPLAPRRDLRRFARASGRPLDEAQTALSGGVKELLGRHGPRRLARGHEAWPLFTAPESRTVHVLAPAAQRLHEGDAMVGRMVLVSARVQPGIFLDEGQDGVVQRRVVLVLARRGAATIREGEEDVLVPEAVDA